MVRKGSRICFIPVFCCRIQEEREERHKYKGFVNKLATPVESDLLDLNMKQEMGSFDNGDPNTTNLYLGNLNPKVRIFKVFGIFGSRVILIFFFFR